MGLVHGLGDGVPRPHCWVHIALHLPNAIGFANNIAPQGAYINFKQRGPLGSTIPRKSTIFQEGS